MTQFIGSQALSDYDEAKVVILPILYGRTIAYRRCQEGAAAIINASNHLEAYDIELELEVCQHMKIFTTEAIASSKLNPNWTPKTMIELVSNRVSELIADGKFALSLKGEHSISAGVVKASRQIERTLYRRNLSRCS